MKRFVALYNLLNSSFAIPRKGKPSSFCCCLSLEGKEEGSSSMTEEAKARLKRKPEPEPVPRRPEHSRFSHWMNSSREASKSVMWLVCSSVFSLSISWPPGTESFSAYLSLDTKWFIFCLFTLSTTFFCL